MMRTTVAFLVVVTILALLPLAHASPPDPTWVAGLYDGADYDDVVLAVTSLAAIIVPFPVTGIGSLAVGEQSPTRQPPRIGGVALLPFAARAPPLL